MYSDYAENGGLPALRPTPAPIAAAPGSGNLPAILQRIEEAIEAETNALRNEPRFDLDASNARKSRALYELSRALRIEGGPRAEHEPAIRRLQEKLAANERAIRAHMAAVGEVAQLIQNAIQSAETDGTYSSAEFGRV